MYCDDGGACAPERRVCTALICSALSHNGRDGKNKRNGLRKERKVYSRVWFLHLRGKAWGGGLALIFTPARVTGDATGRWETHIRGVLKYSVSLEDEGPEVGDRRTLGPTSEVVLLRCRRPNTIIVVIVTQ